MVDVRMPEWINTEEKIAAYKDILALAKEVHASGIIAEEDNTSYFLLEIDAPERSTEIKDRMYAFNDGSRPLLCDVVLEHQNVRGERYVIF